uniref:Uncharacterized protein LOC113797649 n=1 Tax=Dermatophagoides pteronyssinus TaxID=6956 RepID=A0A6P6YGC9_DERPT
MDYEQQNISWTFSLIKRAILITLNVWISIVFLLIIVIWPQNDYLISIEMLNEIVHSNRNDFIIIETIIAFVLRECLYYYHLFELIQYKSKITEIIIKYCQYDDNELSLKYRNYLIQFYQKSHFIVIISYRMVNIEILAVYFLAIFFVFYLYQCGQIKLIKLIMTTIFLTIYVCHCIFIISDSLILLSFIQRKLFWYQFHSDYVHLYSETDQFNQALRYVLLFTEFWSKSVVVIGLLFYSHQTKMQMQNTLIIFIFILVFSTINILNFSIAHIPSYNRVCWLSVHRWIARSQWLNLDQRKLLNRFPLRYSLKSRLFLQSMTRNQFGFTCGR